MNVFTLLRSFLPVTVLVIVAIVTTPATAHQNCTLEVNVTQNGQPVFVSGAIDLPLVFNDGSIYSFDANDLPAFDGQSDFILGGSVYVNNAIGNNGKLMSPFISFVNTSTTTLEFEIIVSWATNYLAGADWNASSSWHLATPGVLFTLPGRPLWAMRLDGDVVGTLFSDPSGMGGPSEGDIVLTTDPISGQNAPVTMSMTAELAFSLSANTAADQDGVILLNPCMSCDGDLDCDSGIQTNDLLLLLASWGACGACPADLNGDDTIDALDLLQMLGLWGECSR